MYFIDFIYLWGCGKLLQARREGEFIDHKGVIARVEYTFIYIVLKHIRNGKLKSQFIAAQLLNC